MSTTKKVFKPVSLELTQGPWNAQARSCFDRHFGPSADLPKRPADAHKIMARVRPEALVETPEPEPDPPPEPEAKP